MLRHEGVMDNKMTCAKWGKCKGNLRRYWLKWRRKMTRTCSRGSTHCKHDLTIQRSTAMTTAVKCRISGIFNWTSYKRPFRLSSTNAYTCMSVRIFLSGLHYYYYYYYYLTATILHTICVFAVSCKNKDKAWVFKYLMAAWQVKLTQ